MTSKIADQNKKKQSPFADTSTCQPLRMRLLEDPSVVSHVGTNDHLVDIPTSNDFDIDNDLNEIDGHMDTNVTPTH